MLYMYNVDVNGIKVVAFNEMRKIFKNKGPSKIQTIENITSTSKMNSPFPKNLTMIIIIIIIIIIIKDNVNNVQNIG